MKKDGGRFSIAHCWAHVRRKFVEIEEQYPSECEQVLELIGALYEIESRCATGPPGDERRAQLRRDESRPIVKQIEKWALDMRALPESGLGKAIRYLGGVWDDGLLRFLDDPAVPLDNNVTERCLRGVVIGRKNHYGSRSERGTQVAALFYGLIESAKLASVGPYTYLRAATNAALRDAPVLLPHQLA